MKNKELSLGEILAQNKSRSEQEKRDAENARIFAEDKAHKEKYEYIEKFFNEAKETIASEILNGKEKILISTYRKKYLPYGEMSFNKGKPKIANEKNLFKNIWDDFNKWADDNGLVIKLFDCYDSGGIESWTEIGVDYKVDTN